MPDASATIAAGRPVVDPGDRRPPRRRRSPASRRVASQPTVTRSRSFSNVFSPRIPRDPKLVDSRERRLLAGGDDLLGGRRARCPAAPRARPGSRGSGRPWSEAPGARRRRRCPKPTALAAPGRRRRATGPGPGRRPPGGREVQLLLGAPRCPLVGRSRRPLHRVADARPCRQSIDPGSSARHRRFDHELGGDSKPAVSRSTTARPPAGTAPSVDPPSMLTSPLPLPVASTNGRVAHAIAASRDERGPAGGDGAASGRASVWPG